MTHAQVINGKSVTTGVIGISDQFSTGVIDTGEAPGVMYEYLYQYFK
jgi:hypothetical protein